MYLLAQYINFSVTLSIRESIILKMIKNEKIGKITLKRKRRREETIGTEIDREGDVLPPLSWKASLALDQTLCPRLTLTELSSILHQNPIL